MTLVIVCYCPRCDYFVKTAVQPEAVGSHRCAQCEEPMEVYIAQGAKEVVQWHAPSRPTDDLMAREMWKVAAENESGWDGTPFTDEDWQDLMIESERERWRLAARRVLARGAKGEGRDGDR